MRPSIRRQLVLWLAIPLGTLWLISTTTGYSQALRFAEETYDRELVNSSDSVAARLRVKDDKVVVDLPPAAQAILRHNNTDKFYYKVLKANGEMISGDSILPSPQAENLDEATPRFTTTTIGKEQIRLAQIKLLIPEADAEPVIIEVAETMNSRKRLSMNIFMTMIVPQVLMVVLGATAVWIGVSRGLEPLQFLQKAIASRSRLDLNPVQEDIAPVEVYPLVVSLNDLLSRLREDIKAQQRFIANAAHQLRTPLAGLKAYSSLGLDLKNLDETHGVIQQIDNGLDRTTHMVNQLLALARNEPASMTSTEKSVVELNGLVADVIADRINIAVKKQIDVGYQPAQELANINGDGTSLQQLVSNLIDNALLYTPEGGCVNVVVAQDNGSIRLSVADNGPGIPLEERDKVFERFYRLVGSTGGGSGLGLSIVKEVAKNHKATVKIENGENNKGTTVSVLFPTS